MSIVNVKVLLHHNLECYTICIIYIENGSIDLLYLSNMDVYFKKNDSYYKIMLYF